jgi:hypothetical protein
MERSAGDLLWVSGEEQYEPCRIPGQPDRTSSQYHDFAVDRWIRQPAGFRRRNGLASQKVTTKPQSCISPDRFENFSPNFRTLTQHLANRSNRPSSHSAWIGVLECPKFEVHPALPEPRAYPRFRSTRGD